MEEWFIDAYLPLSPNVLTIHYGRETVTCKRQTASACSCRPPSWVLKTPGSQLDGDLLTCLILTINIEKPTITCSTQLLLTIHCDTRTATCSSHTHSASSCRRTCRAWRTSWYLVPVQWWSPPCWWLWRAPSPPQRCQENGTLTGRMAQSLLRRGIRVSIMF